MFLDLLVEAGSETAVFNPVLLEGVTGSVEASFGAVEVNLAVVTHPDFADRSNRNQRSTQRFDAVGEAIDSAVVYSLEDVEVAGADEMTTANPSLHFLLGFGGEGVCGPLEVVG